MDIAQLTDAELRDSLRDHGVNVGPIVASTRSVYEKKLAKLVSNDESRNDSVVAESSPKQRNGHHAKSSPVISKKPASPAPVHVQDQVIEEVPADVNNEASDSDYEGEESMRFLTEEEMAADRAAARQMVKRKGGIFGNFVAFAFVFVLIAVFSYFVLENAEQIKMLTERKSDDVI